jgi:hypothetical protein
MFNILIHHPWVYFYLVYAGAWSLFHVWYCLRHPNRPETTTERHDHGRSTNAVS